MKIKQQVTPKEKEILWLIAQGKTSSEIAEILKITENTVETHRKHLLEKFNAINACHLIYIVTKAAII